MLKKLYVFFILLVSVEFFTLSFIGEELQKNLEAVAIISLVLLITAKLINDPIRIKDALYKEAKKGIIIILIAVFLSSFSALWFYQQPLQITLIAQRSMYFYLFFFFLYQYKIEIKFLEKILIIMGILFSLVYFLAVFSPNLITAKILEERGTFRIGLPGLIYIIIGLFYSLQKIIYESNYKYVFLALLFVANIIATGTRTIIGITILLSVFYLYKSLQKKNIFSTLLALSVFIVGVFIFYNIIEFVILLYERAFAGQEGNFQIRLYAISFFITDLFKSNFAYIFGNGFGSELSSYGNQLLYLKKKYGLYLSDIGIIGDYIRYGILFILGVVIIIKSVIKSNYLINNTFIIYSFYFIILSIFTLSNFGTQSVIPAITILLYLISLYKERKIIQ